MNLHDFKALATFGDDVHAPVFMFLYDVEDFRGAANLGNLAFLGAQHTERLLALQALSNHLFVTWLENVQRQGGSRKQNRIQRKQRQQHIGHRHSMNCILCLRLCPPVVTPLTLDSFRRKAYKQQNDLSWESCSDYWIFDGHRRS